MSSLIKARARYARKLFQLGKEKTGKKPMALITDGLPVYHDAYKKEFWT